MARTRSTSRQTFAWSIYAVVVAAGAVSLLISIPGTVRFLPEAPPEFWLLSIFALLLELIPLTIPHEGGQPTRLAVSLCLTFAILLLWGSAEAIVVQALALSVAELRLRRPLTDFAFTVARFSLAFQAAGWAANLIGRPPMRIGLDIEDFGVGTVVVTALVWFLVSNGLIALMLAATGRPAWLKWAGPALYYDMAATASLLMLGPALITAPTGWTVALLAVPLALFGQLSRALRAQERNLNHDPITRLMNLRGLGMSADRLLTARWPTSDPPQLGVLLVRLSGLGDVTNMFGRLVTDHLVRQVGERLTGTASEDVVVGRVAAGDFLVLLPRADAARAERFAAAIARDLLAPIEVDGVLFPVRPTVGIAIAPADGTDLGSLTARAETAVMDARRTGALVRTVHDDDVEARRRLALLQDLRAAIEQPGHANELSVLYQPQVRIDDGHLVGVEALIRWQHPERGRVDTADMILTAEASGVIQLLTLRVLDDVLAQLAAWASEGLRLRASVNVSAKDFASDRFAHQVKLCLRRYAVAPEQLELEITESALVVANPSVDQTVADLAAMGVGLSLDDFGTGFASLQQLRNYPLREIKIDRSYIAAMTTSSADRAVVASITRLATDLGMRVVAEGVEDATTAAELAQIGPLIGQGWYYGRPMSAPDLLAWIYARTDHA